MWQCKTCHRIKHCIYKTTIYMVEYVLNGHSDGANKHNADVFFCCHLLFCETFWFYCCYFCYSRCDCIWKPLKNACITKPVCALSKRETHTRWNISLEQDIYSKNNNKNMAHQQKSSLAMRMFLFSNSFAIR